MKLTTNQYRVLLILDSLTPFTDTVHAETLQYFYELVYPPRNIRGIKRTVASLVMRELAEGTPDSGWRITPAGRQAEQETGTRKMKTGKRT